VPGMLASRPERRANCTCMGVAHAELGVITLKAGTASIAGAGSGVNTLRAGAAAGAMSVISLLVGMLESWRRTLTSLSARGGQWRITGGVLEGMDDVIDSSDDKKYGGGQRHGDL
jgi:hypothetical protein